MTSFKYLKSNYFRRRRRVKARIIIIIIIRREFYMLLYTWVRPILLESAQERFILLLLGTKVSFIIVTNTCTTFVDSRALKKSCRLNSKFDFDIVLDQAYLFSVKFFFKTDVILRYSMTQARVAELPALTNLTPNRWSPSNRNQVIKSNECGISVQTISTYSYNFSMYYYNIRHLQPIESY